MILEKPSIVVPNCPKITMITKVCKNADSLWQKRDKFHMIKYQKKKGRKIPLSLLCCNETFSIYDGLEHWQIKLCQAVANQRTKTGNPPFMSIISSYR